MSEIALKPHRAVLHVRLEVHDLLDSGECSGHPVRLPEHPSYGLKSSMVIAVDGFDRHDCLAKVKAKLEELSK
jgi:hypothetical protein